MLQLFELLLYPPVGLHLLLYLLEGVEDGGVVAVELLADGGVGHVEQLAAEVDGDVARVDDVARALVADQVLLADLEELAHHLLDVLDGEVLRRSAGEVVLEQSSHVVDGEAVGLEELYVGDDLDDGALELADVGAGVFGDVDLDVLGDGQGPRCAGTRRRSS